MLNTSLVWAQGTADSNGSNLGLDPGLPAEAPPPQMPRANPSRGSRLQQSPTLPAPPPEQLVQPYSDGPAAPGPMPTAPSPTTASPSPSPSEAPSSPAPKAKAILNGKLAELNLSPEQAQQIIELRRQWKPENEKRLKEEFSILKQNLAQSMADPSSGEEVRRRFEAMQRKYLELQTVKFDKLLRIREVLTPEQRKKFAELRSRSGSSPASAGAND